MDIILRSSHRYLISGVVFTIFGPTLFWVLYPLGAMLGLALSITVAHTARYFVFRVFVFTRNQGYRVSPLRYLISICPAVLAEFLVTSLTYRLFSRTVVVALATVVSICIGYLSSKYIFSPQESYSSLKKLVMRE